MPIWNATATTLDVDASVFPDGIYGAPSISDDGRYVAFGLRSSTLIGGAAATRAQVALSPRGPALPHSGCDQTAHDVHYPRGYALTNSGG